MKFVDIGANLTDSMYSGLYHGRKSHDVDIDDILERASNSGLTHVMITSGCLKDIREAVNVISERQSISPQLSTTIGVHPTRCGEFDKHQGGAEKYFEDIVSQLKENASLFVAVGEMGLDYDRFRFCKKETQIKYFKKQLEWFGEEPSTQNLPYFLHNRNTGSDFYDIIKKKRDCLPGGVVHSFTGSKDEVREAVELGLFIGVNGCSFKTNENIETVREIPIENLLLETDAPWCSIRPTHASFSFVKTKYEEKKKDRFERGKLVKGRNEPCCITQVAEVVAALKDMSVEEVAEICYDNTLKLFF